MARKEIYITAGELKKGDIIDTQEVISKRNLPNGVTKLLLQGCITGNLVRVKFNTNSYYQIVRYT